MSDINRIKRETLKAVFAESTRDNNGFIADANNDNIDIAPIIESFTPSCEGFDRRIVALASSINSIKSEIVVLYTNAYDVGCGTTV